MRLRAASGVLIGLVVLLSGCAKPYLDFSERAAERVREQELGGFPYHPLVYQLDLAVLAYHLYAQSLVWPFDPYYEDADDRVEAMQRVWAWASEAGPGQAGAGLEAIRGPGTLAGQPGNRAHDPILFRYSGIEPRAAALCTDIDTGFWSEFQPVPGICDRIGEVWVARRAFGRSTPSIGPIDSATVEVLRVDAPPAGEHAGKKQGAQDLLIAFEGATGDKGQPGQPHSQSLMGFTLVRETGDGSYDVHIAFRGSRSGSTTRAAFEASSTLNATGNPDWITDLGFRLVRHSLISAEPEHQVARGMAQSIQWTMPQILSGLDRLVAARKGTPPRMITVVGHSLGGALAQFFTSAVLMGDRYGPGGEGMPASLRAWPWKKLKLITLGAPRVGNRLWAEELTTGRLESRFYDTHFLTPYDLRATGVTNIDIKPRLINPNRPLALRVLVPSDAVTSGRPLGEHAGQTVYLEHPTYFSIADGDSHEPQRMRRDMLEALRDPQIPAAPWTYVPLEDYLPTRGDEDLGFTEEYRKTAGRVRSFRNEHDPQGWNLDEFNSDFSRFVELVVPTADSE
jgi:lipase (class 3)